MAYGPMSPRFYLVDDLLFREDEPGGDVLQEPLYQWNGRDWIRWHSIEWLEKKSQRVTEAEAEAFLIDEAKKQGQELTPANARGRLHRVSLEEIQRLAESRENTARRRNARVY